MGGKVEDMARLGRVVVPNVPHHLTQRGNRGEAAFFDDADWRRYLQLLGEHIDGEETGQGGNGKQGRSPFSENPGFVTGGP